MATWACDHCQSFSKSHRAVQQGKQEELSARCLLLKKLMHHVLENAISLSKTKLRSVSSELKLPHSADVSKDKLISSMCDVMVENANYTAECMISSIEDE